MTSNTICSYCNNEHTISHDTVCNVFRNDLFSYKRETYFTLEIDIRPLKNHAVKFIQPNTEAIEYLKSIKGFY